MANVKPAPAEKATEQLTLRFNGDDVRKLYKLLDRMRIRREDELIMSIVVITDLVSIALSGEYATRFQLVRDTCIVTVHDMSGVTAVQSSFPFKRWLRYQNRDEAIPLPKVKTFSCMFEGEDLQALLGLRKRTHTNGDADLISHCFDLFDKLTGIVLSGNAAIIGPTPEGMATLFSEDSDEDLEIVNRLFWMS